MSLMMIMRTSPTSSCTIGQTDFCTSPLPVPSCFWLWVIKKVTYHQIVVAEGPPWPASTFFPLKNDFDKWEGTRCRSLLKRPCSKVFSPQGHPEGHLPPWCSCSRSPMTRKHLFPLKKWLWQMGGHSLQFLVKKALFQGFLGSRSSRWSSTTMV